MYVMHYPNGCFMKRRTMDGCKRTWHWHRQSIWNILSKYFHTNISFSWWDDACVCVCVRAKQGSHAFSSLSLIISHSLAKNSSMEKENGENSFRRFISSFRLMNEMNWAIWAIDLLLSMILLFVALLQICINLVYIPWIFHFKVSILTELPNSSLIITMNDIILKNEMHTIMGLRSVSSGFEFPVNVS